MPDFMDIFGFYDNADFSQAEDYAAFAPGDSLAADMADTGADDFAGDDPDGLDAATDGDLPDALGDPYAFEEGGAPDDLDPMEDTLLFADDPDAFGDSDLQDAPDDFLFDGDEDSLSDPDGFNADDPDDFDDEDFFEDPDDLYDEDDAPDDLDDSDDFLFDDDIPDADMINANGPDEAFDPDAPFDPEEASGDLAATPSGVFGANAAAGQTGAVQESIFDRYFPDNNLSFIPSPESYGPQVMNFTADRYNPEYVFGDPLSAMQSFHVQEGPSSCSLVSQEFVLEQLLGGDFHEHDLCMLAHQNGWYDPAPDGGTFLSDMGNVLAAYGLDVSITQNASVDDLIHCFQNGGQAIVAVDSTEMYAGDNDSGYFGPGLQPDHAVHVIGLDSTDADSPMVILNDPGHAGGCGAMVPLQDFLDAWEDSGYLMVTAYAPEPMRL